MDNIDCVKKKMEWIIKKSQVPEDPVHSKNTLEWLLKLKPDADDALKIAALGHDIERAIAERKVRREDYKDYDEFKEAHASNSAKILAEIMKECNISKKLADDVVFLVCHHETGGTRRIDILRDADSISFFHVNLPYYFLRNGVEETKRRCLWGYKKLPKNMQEVVVKFNYKDKELKSLVMAWIAGR
ncbi:MAG: DUF4202 family protein [Methanophagales archaeon]|jgi:hypothetical protein|nr:DUF4202 family protein [Methanophagales archaeon]NQE54800.1 hypothetical protein [ANME-1 cluster archaeon GoMg3.2]